MTFINNSTKIIDHIRENISHMSLEETEKLIETINQAESIFIFGAGRSGLAGRAFAMRLVHLGKRVNFVGEVTTPAITDKDLLIVISGSGTTPSVLNVVRAAKSRTAKVIGITSKESSPMADLTDSIVKIPECRHMPELSVSNEGLGGDYLARQLDTVKIMPMGTLFELTVMIYFDSVVSVLMDKLKISEELMKCKHANLE